MENTRKRDGIFGDIPRAPEKKPKIDEAAGGIDDVNEGKKIDEDANFRDLFMEKDEDDVQEDDEDSEEDEDGEVRESGSSESDCEPVLKRAKIKEGDLRIHKKQGFDVDAVPGSSPMNTLITSGSIRGNRRYYTRIVRFAIRRHMLWTKSNGVKPMTILKVTSQFRPWHRTYIAFEGKDLADDKIKTYQTCLVSVTGVGRVLKLFRLKPLANHRGCKSLVQDERSLSWSDIGYKASLMPDDSDPKQFCKQTEFLDKARKACTYRFVRHFRKLKEEGQHQSCYERVHKFSRVGLERYCRHVEESEGCDVSLHPGMGLYGLITPIARPWSKSFRKRVHRCSQLTIEYFNKRECPIQPNNVVCGYYVMRFMREIIYSQMKHIPIKFTSKRVYTLNEINEVRKEWADIATLLTLQN